jgi:transposase-like protein
MTSTEFKNSAIKLYFNIESIRNVCNLLDIKKSTLHRWLIIYFEIGNVERKEYDERKSIINDTILKYITDSIKTNPTITLAKLKKNYLKIMKKIYQYHTFIILLNIN